MPPNEMSRKQRAASAGFMKFCPSPPNSIFTIRTANTLPSAAIHSGTVAGRVYAKSTPDTAALQSPTVTGSFMSFS